MHKDIPSPYDIVFSYVVLPDSMAERKKVLQAMAVIVTQQHAAFKSICAQIAAIEKLELLQKDLPLKFSTPPPKSKLEGDGQ